MLIGVELEAAENSAREQFSGMMRNGYLVHTLSEFCDLASSLYILFGFPTLMAPIKDECVRVIAPSLQG